MTDLQGEHLKTHVDALAKDIGARPPGHPEEEQAREYIRQQLRAAGITDTEQMHFTTPDSWGYGLIYPLIAVLAGGLVARFRGLGRLIGLVLSGIGTFDLYQMLMGRSEKQMLYELYPKQPHGGTLLARIPPEGEVRQRVVLIGHTDTNKHRISFSPVFKKTMTYSGLSLMVAVAAHTLGVLLRWHSLRDWSLAYVGLGTGILAADEAGGFVKGGNDNASAVACTLGIGEHLAQNPLQHTEVWLAFTGSEEVGHFGLHALLDRRGETLRDAWFIDFELVGSGDIAYVTHHSGLMVGSDYAPDAESVALARRVAAQNPDLNITGRDVVILEEVATLRRRGFRGLCLVGLDEEGWLANWHQYSDTADNVHPEPLEKAAHFALAMIHDLDQTDDS